MDQDNKPFKIYEGIQFSWVVESIARDLCKSKGIDPDQETTGLDRLASSGFKYPLWMAWALDVDFVIRQYKEEMK